MDDSQVTATAFMSCGSHAPPDWATRPADSCDCTWIEQKGLNKIQSEKIEFKEIHFSSKSFESLKIPLIAVTKLKTKKETGNRPILLTFSSPLLSTA